YCSSARRHLQSFPTRRSSDLTKENAVRQTRRRSIYNNEASRQRPIISFEDVTKKYQNGVEALRNLSFRIEEGEFVFLMGSSGARSEEHTSELQSRFDLVCRLL